MYTIIIYIHIYQRRLKNERKSERPTDANHAAVVTEMCDDIPRIRVSSGRGGEGKEVGYMKTLRL